MRKILLFFISFLLVVNIAYSQDDWFINSQNLIINVNLSSGADITPRDSDYKVDYIKVNLTHYPYGSFNQEVVAFEVYPEAKKESNSLQFEWQNPKSKISFGYRAKMKTSNDLIEITEKIPFPIADLPEDLKPFIQPQEIIDSNDEDVINLASQLVEGQDDLYVVVDKLAEWTKGNIKYDLSTLTADVSQKASWVLENREGVCDELTSLFIAMLRSVGIPAKFVSGVAYTNSDLFPENWGSHGWAEVYFPGYGWVPYDVTYGQFGYIDPTHVKLKESIDSAEPSVQYKWLSRNVDLETKDLDVKADVEAKSGRAGQPIGLGIDVLKDNVGFGSYNLIMVSLENLEDYYISSEIYLSRPKEVELTENFAKNIVLKPKEKKSVFWIAKISENLENNYAYTFPVTVSTLRNFTESIEFKSAKNDIVLSLEDIHSVLRQKQEEEQKIYSKDVSIGCSIDKNEFYSYETALVQCRVKNIGNAFLENFDFCLANECEKFDLGISQEKSFNFSVEDIREEKQQLVLDLKNADVSKAAYLDVDVLDAPNITISRIEAPAKVGYKDEYKLSFLLEKKSRSSPKNVEITLSNKNIKKAWVVSELSEDRKFIVNLLGKDLSKGANEFNIDVKYQDNNRKKYEASENFAVELSNVTLVQNILLAFHSITRSLEKPKTLLLVGISSLIVFFLIIRFIFKRK
ncbi:transglutaminase domain-containing protein [Candidatus Woesearchaeota archaeon]|nr:transglutaminase domain-containing protein [Candidatus Woesearchaeota archaeon]